ncbi:beta-glucuronidase-like isoform X2 [Artemia franciscana]|uniref:Beta-glucuronidase n=2 Tax=Artemia franciscana TaxID=6661 RepID=A0AA88IDT5_ARTSF|nr:hypothetical protein QYM36_005421 [Artemia franciscana]
MKLCFSLIFFSKIFVAANGPQGILYPQQSESRELFSLDGVWTFAISPKFDQDIGFKNQWYRKELKKVSKYVIPMPVPSSYNDITQNATIRDYVGWVWYERTFFVPARWRGEQRVFLRFGSANYETVVWINGVKVTNHSGGYLPFVAEVTKQLSYGSENKVTVALNNTLTPLTIPQGRIVFPNNTDRYPPGYFIQEYNFDFTNYAGIHRPVYLYTTPRSYIDDVTVTTETSEDNYFGTIRYSILCQGCSKDAMLYTDLLDEDGANVASNFGPKNKISFKRPKLWWPNLMHERPGYLYTLKIHLKDGDVEDFYRLKIGVRSLSWNSSGIFINHQKVYFQGFGKHEDFLIKGRGVDYSLIVKDFNLINWLGANSFRTSHYPYAEEIMDFADKNGIMVIDEIPGVGLDHFGADLLKNHLEAMKELIHRDKNRPSVVMWSIGNEPQSQKPEAAPYYSQVVNFTKLLDPTRPVTLVLSRGYFEDKAAPFLDVICFNRYYSWYSDTGHLELIQQQLLNEARNWHNKFRKPVMMTEYGAGSIAGFHSDPPVVWTEDYQTALMKEYFKGFDILRKEGFFIGEMIWNFADFGTPQGSTRVFGNHKGIFARDRSPKPAAHLLKQRYESIVTALK